MSKDISINVYDNDNELNTSVNEFEAHPGDRVVVSSSSQQDLTLFFTLGNDLNTSTERQTFPAGTTIPPIEIPISPANGQILVSTFHVMSDGGWPKIMIRRPTHTGTR